MNVPPSVMVTTPPSPYTSPATVPIKPLTLEIEEPVKFSFSGEGILLSELAERAPDGFKAPKISQASIKMVEQEIKLMSQMKTQRLAGQSTGNHLQDLVAAYDHVQKNLNENGENSQKHTKFLDDAFMDLSRHFITQEASQQHLNSIDYNDEEQNPNLNADAANRLKLVIADAEKKAAAFADSFLKNFKKHGLAAFDTAMLLL